MSPEYYRGVQAAFQALHAGESKHAYLRAIECDERISGPDAFNAGAKAQCHAWPEVLPMPPTNYVEQQGGRACGAFMGLALTGLLVLVAGFPKLSGPAAGAIFIAVVISGIAAFRNKR